MDSSRAVSRFVSAAPLQLPLALFSIRTIPAGNPAYKRISNPCRSGLNSLGGAHSVLITRPLTSGGLRNKTALRRIRGVRFLVIPHVQPPGTSRAEQWDLGMLASLLIVAAQTVVAIGNFEYVEGTDPMNDRGWVTASLHSPEADLSFACDHNRANTIFVVLETRNSLAYTSSPLLAQLMSFEYRVDQNDPISEFTTYSDTTAILEGARARAMAERLAAGSQVVVRVDGYSGPIVAQFAANGSREAITRVATQCGDNRLLRRLARSAATQD